MTLIEDNGMGIEGNTDGTDIDEYGTELSTEESLE